jgi:hypothetical protein
MHDRARELYAAFVDTFTEPDSTHGWMVAEARRALERLAREK